MNLLGYSGCKLEIITVNSIKYIKKTSSNFGYNSRLKAQKEKQEKLQLAGFEVCPVISDGIDSDGLYFFIMEYINGVTLAERIDTLQLNEIDELANRFLKGAVCLEDDNTCAREIFCGKIQDVRDKLGDNCSLVTKKTIVFLLKCPWEYIVESSCHGDMTLQNIIIYENDFYLIDCLDSFYGSWMIDVAKVLQDAELMWTYREQKEKNSNLLIRLTALRDLIVEKIADMKNGEKMLTAVYSALLLNVLRIVPYAKDAATLRYLDCQMIYLQKKISGGEF